MRGAVGPRTPLFEGLDAAALAAVYGRMTARSFAAGETLCVEGDEGNSLFVLQSGVAAVAVRGGGVVARLRRGDVAGEMSLLTGEPRSATVTAVVPTTALEMDREAFTGALATYPRILTNLTSILSARLARTTARSRGDKRGEAIALVVADAPRSLVVDVVAGATASSPRPVTHLVVGDPLDSSAADGTRARHAGSVAQALGALDDLLDAHATVILEAAPDLPDLPDLLDQVDRVVALGPPEAVARLTARLPALAGRIEMAPIGGPLSHGSPAPARIMRDERDTAWLGRHLARTKLGLALGAGGAKGYAHIATLHALERAGYTIDFLAGSSIGAVIGAWHALGRDAAAVEATMRAAFTPDNVAAMFKLGASGMSSGLDVLTKVCQESTGGKSFADLQAPLIMMSVDLNTRQPVAITAGSLWEGCLAAMAVAGIYPPFQHDNERLVDAVALVPVPAGALFAAGADIAVAVNLMSRDGLPAWPGEEAAPLEAKGSRVRMLDTLMEVMDLAQMDASIRHAASADVVITPRFGPASWRDFYLADRILDAGGTAAAAALGELSVLARPTR